MSQHVLPPEPMTNEAIASRLTNLAKKKIRDGLIKKRILFI